MAKDIGKYIRKNLSGKHNQKPLDHTEQSATDEFKTTSKKINSKKQQS